MSTIVGFILAILAWAILCIVLQHIVTKHSLSVLGKEMAYDYVRRKGYVSWFSNERGERPDVFSFLTSPFSALIYLLNKDRVIDRLTKESEMLKEEAENLRRARYRSGRVWMHPFEHALWSRLYRAWYFKEIQPDIIKAQAGAYKYRSVGKANRAMKMGQPCPCAEPLLNGPKSADEPHDYCKEGHVLPKNSYEMLF